MKTFKSFYEDMTFKVEVDGLPALFMSGNSPGEVKSHLRKLIKQPSMIKNVERQTKHDVKKMYRKKAQGKDIDEGLNELSPDTVSRYKKAASKSNYAAAQKYARVAASPTSRKYKNKEMDRLDNIGRKRKAGLAMADRKESLDERTPIRPTIQDPKLKNLRVPNPKYKGAMKRKKENERSADKFREDNVNEKLTIGKIRRAAYKTGKVLGDVNAVKKGKVAKRIKNRVVGKLLGKVVGKLGLFK
jgi:hypothetical protein